MPKDDLKVEIFFKPPPHATTNLARNTDSTQSRQQPPLTPDTTHETSITHTNQPTQSPVRASSSTTTPHAQSHMHANADSTLQKAQCALEQLLALQVQEIENRNRRKAHDEIQRLRAEFRQAISPLQIKLLQQLSAVVEGMHANIREETESLTQGTTQYYREFIRRDPP